MPQPLQVRVYQSLEDLQSLRPAWEELLADVPNASTFSTWEWLAPWWRAFGNGQRLLVLAFSDHSSRLVGLASLSLGPRRVMKWLELRVLRLMGDGSGDSDNLDLLARRGSEEEVIAVLLDYLETQARHWDLCEFNTLPGDSPCGNALLRQLRQRGWTHFSYRLPWSRVALPDTWERYLEILPSRARGNLLYELRRLERKYKTRFYRCTNEADLSSCLGVLFELHQKRWRRRDQAGSFASPPRRRFYQDVSSLLLARKQLEFWLLELNGRPVSADFGMRYGTTVFALQSGFDPDYYRDSAGYVLKGYMIRQLIADGVRRYDFLFGEGPEKARWGAEVANYINVHFARPFSRGSAYLRFVHGAGGTKTWLRARLPERAWALLHGINLWLRRSAKRDS